MYLSSSDFISSPPMSRIDMLLSRIKIGVLVLLADVLGHNRHENFKKWSKLKDCFAKVK